MLVREIQSIEAAVSNAWSRVARDLQNRHSEAAQAAVDGFKSDLRHLELTKCLADSGVINADVVAWGMFNGTTSFGGAGTPRHGPKGLYADIQATRKAVPSPDVPSLGMDPSFSELDIALKTCTMKWAALQSYVYLFVTDLSVAKTFDDIRAAVRVFTSSIK